MPPPKSTCKTLLRINYSLRHPPLCFLLRQAQTSKVKLRRFASASASLPCYFLTEQFLFAHSTVCAILSNQLPNHFFHRLLSGRPLQWYNQLLTKMLQLRNELAHGYKPFFPRVTRFSSKLFCEIHTSEFLDQHVDRVVDSLFTGGLLAYIQIWNHWACWCQCHNANACRSTAFTPAGLSPCIKSPQKATRFQTSKNAYDDTHQSTTLDGSQIRSATLCGFSMSNGL